MGQVMAYSSLSSGCPALPLFQTFPICLKDPRMGCEFWGNCGNRHSQRSLQTIGSVAEPTCKSWLCNVLCDCRQVPPASVQ